MATAPDDRDPGVAATVMALVAAAVLGVVVFFRARRRVGV
jgi:hypothetical protein